MQPRSSLKTQVDRCLHSPQVEFAIVMLILLSVLLVVVELGIDLSSTDYATIQTVDGLITGIFVVELCSRYLVARNKRRFFRHYWFDIIAVLPFYRIVHVLRVLRILRLLRVGILLNRNLNRVASVRAASLSVQLGVLSFIGLTILTGAISIYLFERSHNEDFASFKDAVWWSFFTLVSAEPIGGDPKTDAGRLVTLLVMIGGLTIFAVFTGVVSAIMVQRLKTAMEVKYLELDELRDHIVICGWNRSAHLLIEELQADPGLRHSPIVVVAEFAEFPDHELRRIDRSQLYLSSGDYTMIDVLESVGIHYATRAILLADSLHPRSDQDRDARTVLAALTIEKLNPNIYTCAQLLDRKNDVQLRVAGVEDVIIADELASHLIATSARNQGTANLLSELLTVQVGNQFYQINLPEDWIGITFWEAAHHLKTRFDGILVAVERRNEKQRDTIVNPPKDYPLLAGDRLTIIARQLPALK
ncbi:ion transporter [Leptothermofonsia sichuanensis E412]|uniref:ion transporter n=1 Tax=Leptothermofonsia sichuanensis TaxID=2917832 RepID=UPI001CA73FF0|nr:ion transporter [Leptothermofonsia sichuanensis]QZZ22257.1 ion transporter [Leptothermofonsia sichuanensis E412]